MFGLDALFLFKAKTSEPIEYIHVSSENEKFAAAAAAAARLVKENFDPGAVTPSNTVRYNKTYVPAPSKQDR